MRNPILPLLLGAAALLPACRQNALQHDAAGTLEAPYVIVSAEVAGRILQLDVREGDTVAAGAVVARIDPVGLELQKAQVEATQAALLERTVDPAPQIAVLKEQIAAQSRQVDVLAGQMAVLQRERERFARLVAADAVQRKQLEDIDGQMEVLVKQQRAAFAQVRILEEQVEAQQANARRQNRAILSENRPLSVREAQLQDQLARTEVRNPQRGRVLLTYAEAGEFTSPGKPLYKIADTDTLFLRAYLTGDQLTAVRLGQAVRVMADDGQGGFRPYPGRIDWISEEAEFTPKTIMTRDERANLVYAVKVRVPNDGLLKLGMYAELDLGKQK